jgi:hypothetical protein
MMSRYEDRQYPYEQGLRPRWRGLEQVVNLRIHVLLSAGDVIKIRDLADNRRALGTTARARLTLALWIA